MEWTGVEHAGDQGDAGAGGSIPDLLQHLTDRLAAVEHLIAGLVGVDPVPDAELVSALAQRNDELAAALLRRVDERFRALLESLDRHTADIDDDGSIDVGARLDVVERRLAAIEALLHAPPGWLPDVLTAIVDADADHRIAATVVPDWAAQLRRELQTLRSTLARLVG
ncbi:MAG: hypothetical protein ACRD0G_16180 [Acidimicrobiales bacterium]